MSEVFKKNLQKYYDCNLKIVPTNGKVPQLKNWQFDSPKSVEEFLEKSNSYTTGGALVCGYEASGIVVVDVDPRNGGLQSFEALKNRFPDLLSTVIVDTPSGGFHLYYRSDFQMPKLQSFLRGIDFQGENSLANIPGSRHPNGKLYKFRSGHELGSIEIARLPNKFRDLLLSEKELPINQTADFVQIVEGTRNETLFKYASKLIGDGLPAALLIEKIAIMNQVKCVPPLSSKEVEAICKSCLKSAKRFYSIVDGGFAVGGENISNFHLRITTKVSKDDGENREDHYVLEGAYATGETIEPFTISAAQFHSGDFLRMLDVKAIVRVGAYMEDHVIAAIKSISDDIKTDWIYSHTGFRKIDNRWVYLHSDGAITAEGNDPSLKVDLGMPQLKPYKMEFEADKEIEKDCIKAVFDFLDLAPDRITFAIIGMNFRAPTASIKLITTILFFCGITGCFKSVMAALKLSFFGSGFNYDKLTANFECTPNSLEKMAYTIKDMPFVIDDLAPDGTLKDSQQKSKTAIRYVRTAGNGEGSARGRLTKDYKLKTSFYPRCQTDMTGEDVPPGQSIIARLLALSFEQNLINLKNLTKAQDLAASGVYVKAMTSYISWLCGRYEKVQADVPKRLIDLRSQSSNLSGHKRTPEAIANLALGFEMFLQFAVEKEILTDEDAKKYENRAWAAFKVIDENQRSFLKSEDPCQNFINYLRSAMLMGKSHMKNYTNTKLPPFDYEAFGWFHDSISGELKPKGSAIGWVDLLGEEIIFDPGGAFLVAQEVARAQGTSINLSQDTLWRRLGERGFILKSDSDGRNTIKRSPEDEKRKRFIIFRNFDLFMDEKMNSTYRSQVDKETKESISALNNWQKKRSDAAK
ncbi:bifunctional DNA primase/polymerase [bacterium]|nr:bifunctional DNA primase/polymerase [bacterium]